MSASPVVEHGSMLTTLCLCIDQNLLDSQLPYDAWVGINQRNIHCNDIFKYCFCDFTRRLYHFTPQKCSPQSRVQNSMQLRYRPTFLTYECSPSQGDRNWRPGYTGDDAMTFLLAYRDCVTTLCIQVQTLPLWRTCCSWQTWGFNFKLKKLPK